MAPRKKAAAKPRRRGRCKKTKGRGRKAVAKRSRPPKPPSQRSILSALTKTIKQSTEDTTVKLESTMLCDPNMPLERPTVRDWAALGRFAGPGYIQLFSEMAVASIEAESRGGPDNDSGGPRTSRRKALPPAIPQWDDDTKESASVTYFAGIKRIKHIHLRRQEGGHEPPTFTSLPVEVKDIIYRYLLLAESAIQVHSGWRSVYKGAKRNRLALHPSILRVSRASFAQASRILYGENTFLYLLRDTPNSVPDLRRLLEDDDRSSAGEEAESDSDYDDSSSRAVVAARRRAPRKRRAHKNDINFNKYSWLMRRIAVQAESNRYSPATQDSMATAIRMFANKPSAGRRTRQRNIHTLTVRVAPRRIAAQGGPHHDEDNYRYDYTFANFFEPGSRVLRAIKSIECQYLHVDLLRDTGAARGSRGAATERGCRLFVDMRYQRLERISLGNTLRDDLWARDRLMLHHRKQLKDRSAAAVNQLALTIRQHCSQWAFDDGESEVSDLEGSEPEDHAAHTELSAAWAD